MTERKETFSTALRTTDSGVNPGISVFSYSGFNSGIGFIVPGFRISISGKLLSKSLNLYREMAKLHKISIFYAKA
jgi:hypothetical protein